MSICVIDAQMSILSRADANAVYKNLFGKWRVDFRREAQSINNLVRSAALHYHRRNAQQRLRELAANAVGAFATASNHTAAGISTNGGGGVSPSSVMGAAGKQHNNKVGDTSTPRGILAGGEKGATPTNNNNTSMVGEAAAVDPDEGFVPPPKIDGTTLRPLILALKVTPVATVRFQKQHLPMLARAAAAKRGGGGGEVHVGLFGGDGGEERRQRVGGGAARVRVGTPSLAGDTASIVTTGTRLGTFHVPHPSSLPTTHHHALLANNPSSSVSFRNYLGSHGAIGLQASGSAGGSGGLHGAFAVSRTTSGSAARYAQMGSSAGAVAAVQSSLLMGASAGSPSHSQQGHQGVNAQPPRPRLNMSQLGPSTGASAVVSPKLSSSPRASQQAAAEAAESSLIPRGHHYHALAGSAAQHQQEGVSDGGNPLGDVAVRRGDDADTSTIRSIHGMPSGFALSHGGGPQASNGDAAGHTNAEHGNNGNVIGGIGDIFTSSISYASAARGRVGSLPTPEQASASVPGGGVAAAPHTHPNTVV